MFQKGCSERASRTYDHRSSIVHMKKIDKYIKSYFILILNSSSMTQKQLKGGIYTGNETVD